MSSLQAVKRERRRGTDIVAKKALVIKYTLLDGATEYLAEE